jgi:hypothetical protein
MLVSWPVRIAVLGDRTGHPDDTEFSIAVDAIVAMSPDLILTVGDFVEGNGDCSTAREDWERIGPFLDELESTCPVVYTPGNNDIWDEETLDMWMMQIGSSPSGIQRAEGIAFLVWDTSRTGRLDEENLSELETLITGLDQDEPWLLVTHKPFWFMAYQDSSVVSAFHALMDRTSPLAVVGGHIHLFAAERREGILYVSAGPSGSVVRVPDHEQGKFTQLGWMTVYPDSVTYSVLDARGVYPEGLNTGEEQLLSFLYRRDMIDCNPLDPAMESAVITVHPIEEVDRQVRMTIDPGSWYISPDTVLMTLGDTSEEIHFTLGYGSGLYPLPVLSMELDYGARDKALEFDYVWPVRRHTDAAPGLPVLDGIQGENEYPVDRQTDFADMSGNAATEGCAGFSTMTSQDYLVFYAEMPCPEDRELPRETDWLGIVLESGGEYFWLEVSGAGETSGTHVTGDWQFLDWTSGFEAVVSDSERGWSLEVAFDRNELGLDGETTAAHVYRASDLGATTWAWPLEFDMSTMGEIRLGRTTESEQGE